MPDLVVVVTGLIVVCYRYRHGRGLLGLAAAASLAVAALYIVQAQFRHPNPADFQWPVQFDKVNVLGLLALFLLLAEAGRELLIRRRADHLRRSQMDDHRRSASRRACLSVVMPCFNELATIADGRRAGARARPTWPS